MAGIPAHEDIALAAYLLWKENPDSDAEANWLEAEARLLAKVLDAEMLKSPEVVSVPKRTRTVRG